MPQAPVVPKAARLHTPEELLAGAESLLASRDTLLYRSAVLEAISALEFFVQKTVFTLLEQTTDQRLVDWIRKQSENRFDDRLGILLPIASGRLINKNSDLWQRYKTSKAIRNKVTHEGKAVSLAEARTAVQTVYDWLAFSVALPRWTLRSSASRSTSNVTIQRSNPNSTRPPWWAAISRRQEQHPRSLRATEICTREWTQCSDSDGTLCL